MPAEIDEFNYVPSATAELGPADFPGAARWPLEAMAADHAVRAATANHGATSPRGPAGGAPATEARLRIAIIGSGSVASESYLALQDAGLEVELPGRAGGSATSLSLICNDDGDPAALAGANAAALEAAQPFSFAVVDLHTVRVGPLVLPGHSACHQCLVCAGKARQRRTSRQSPYRAVAARMAGSLAAVQLHNFSSQGDNPLAAGEVITFDLRSNAMSKAVVVRHPDCPACSGI